MQSDIFDFQWDWVAFNRDKEAYFLSLGVTPSITNKIFGDPDFTGYLGPDKDHGVVRLEVELGPIKNVAQPEYSTGDEVSVFATAVADVEDAFNFVTDEIDVDPHLKVQLRTDFTKAHRSGNPQKENLALTPLLTIDWNWPSFDYWHEQFLMTNTWPYMWKKVGLGGNYDGKEVTFAVARVNLLAHTLSMTAYSVRDWHKERKYFATYGWRRVESIGCPAEDAVAEVFMEDASLEDWRSWPPFFPGDRNAIVGLRPSERFQI